MLREARDLLSLVRCAVTGIVYRPLVKRARQRNSRRLELCYAQPPSQYSAQRMIPHIRWIMCILHKNKLKNVGYFMQFFMRSMNFFLPPQYIVLEPAKMRYFQLKSTIYCGRVKLAFPSKIVYHVRSTASHRTAHTHTGSAVLLHRTASAQRIACRCVPCQVNNAQSKPLTRTA